MMRQKLKTRFLAGIMAVMLALFLGAGITAFPVRAASGTVYSCKITPCYAHPVTGVIEDSGGEASYATGQGMVEGAVYTTGMMEVTDSGEYYLTIRMSLVDYSSGHSFTVQNVGDSGWSSTVMGVTGTGKDTNGTTADVCIQVPSENCIVRGSMYVEPMGRNVIFYLYPSGYTAGGVDGMNATMVTEASGSGTADPENDTLYTEESTQETESYEETLPADPVPAEESISNAPALESTLSGETAAPASSGTSDSTGSAELNGTRGLSLSTETEQETGSGGSASMDPGLTIAAVATAVTVSGLILIGVTAFVVYYFRKNWRRWGGAYDDDEDE